MIKEHDQVVLASSIPKEGFEAGDVGVVVHVYPDARAYEVEFMTLAGTTVDVVTLAADQVRAASSREIPHARPFAPM